MNRNKSECLEESIDLLLIVEAMVDSCAAAQAHREGPESSPADFHAPWRGIKRTLQTVRANLHSLRGPGEEQPQYAGSARPADQSAASESIGRGHGAHGDRDRTHDALPADRNARMARSGGGSSLTSRIQMAPTVPPERSAGVERGAVQDRSEGSDRSHAGDRAAQPDRGAGRGSTREIRRPDEPEADGSATVPA